MNEEKTNTVGNIPENGSEPEARVDENDGENTGSEAIENEMIDPTEIKDDIHVLEGDASEEEVEDENIGNRIAELEATVEELNDKLLRALAETENVRRRAQREKEDATKYGIKNFAEGMLGIADNLGRALASINPEARSGDSSIDNIIVGIEMVQKDLVNTFERFGIIPIKALGAKFDPMLHEAMFEIEDMDTSAGTIAQVLEPGYVLNGRTLRAAKVGITKGGPKGDPEPNAESPASIDVVNSSDPASRDGKAAYENQTDTKMKSGGNLDEEL